ncbi:MAG: hypothetical protein ACSHX8_05730 [Opitutaceae bacterium]
MKFKRTTPPLYMSRYYFPKMWLLATVISFLVSLNYGQGRPVRILYYQSPADAPTEAFIYAGKELLTKTDLPRSNFSDTFEIPGGDIQLRFLSQAIGIEQKMPKRAPSATIPEAWQKVLLLVFENAENPILPVRVQAIDASDHVFGAGSVYFMNFSEVGIAGMVGDKQLKLRPKSINVIKNPISENGFYEAKLDAYVAKGEKPRRFIKQMWKHSDQTRMVLFILPKPAPRHVTYYCAPVDDF